jgi:hypothetical protein
VPLVIEKDLGWESVVATSFVVDGLSVRTGILKGKPVQYPAERGSLLSALRAHIRNDLSKGSAQEGPEVAKIAAIHGLIDDFTTAFDSMEKELATGLQHVQERLIKEPDTEPERILMEEIGIPLRDAYRDRIKARGLVKTGRLWTATRSAIFKGAKFLYGDDPKRPQAGDDVRKP